MASSSSDVDSAENLSRWRAMMTRSSQSATETTTSATSSVPRAASTSLNGSGPGHSEPTTSASPGFLVGSIDDTEIGGQSVNGRDGTTPPISRVRADSLNDDQFRTAVHNAMQTSLGTTSTASASQTPAVSGSDTGELIPHLSNPLDIPSVVLPSEHTTQSSGLTSPSSHPHPSPAISGLRAPVNSPQVHASSPQFARGNTHDEDVGAALAWFVQNLNGRSLSESMWAPKNGKYAPSPLRGSQVPSSIVSPRGGSGSCAPSKDLTPVNVVQPNPAINDSFSRMTFRAADAGRRVSDDIIGERNVRPSTASRAVSSGTRPSQNIFAPLGTPEDNDMSQPVSPTSATLTRAAAPSIVQNGIIVTDFAEKKENISSSIPKTAWVPPHLRGKDRASQLSATYHVGLRDEVTESLKDGLTQTLEASSGIPLTSSHMAPETQSSSQPEALDKNQRSAATETSPSLAEIGQRLLMSIVDLESNGYLSAEMIASLYVVHHTIQAQLDGTAEESTGAYCLPAKTYKDPSRPIQKHLVTTTSDAMADYQATKKARVEMPLTIDTVVPDAVTSRSESTTPASGYSSTGIGSANFRKILAATSASTANSPIATQSTLSPEKLASAFASKASASAPSAPDLAKSTSPPSSKVPTIALATCANLAETASREKAKAVSLTPASSSTPTYTVADPKDTEDRQDQTWFSSWGKREERDRPTAKVRTIIITGLPSYATPSFVACLVYGGAVECIQMRSSADGVLTASVRFMDADACKQYYDDTSNGIVYKKDIQNRESVAFVELAKDVDVVGGMLQQWIDNGVTRCVRAVGVDEEWGTDGLKKIAERKNRKLEGISDSKNHGGARSVIFRFCKIEDAVQFKSALVRDQEWEHCNVHFAVDPCATATGMHLNG